MAGFDDQACVAAVAAQTELVERVRAGESAAFQELFFQYRRLVYNLALRLLRDAEDAQDVCQEVFLAVHRRIDSLQDPAKLRPWLCRIAVTRAHNLERSLRRRFRSLTISLENWAETGREARATTGDPDRALASAEARLRIDQALATLAFPLRTVVVLRDLEGLSYEEIAEALDVSLGTVKSRLSRAREALRGQLRDLMPKPREGWTP